MKKTLVVSLLAISFLVVAPHVVAQSSNDFTALAPIPGLTDTSATSVVNADTLANFFNNLYKYLIGLAAILAVIEIIWGGLQYSTQDSVSAKGAGKERIINAIFGLVLVLSPVLVFTIINPSILNLSLNLPPMKTYSSSIVPGSGSNVGGGFSPSAIQTACQNFTDRTHLRLQTTACASLDTNAPLACCGGENLSSAYFCCYVSSEILLPGTTDIPVSGQWCFRESGINPPVGQPSPTGYLCRETEKACNNYRNSVDTNKYQLGSECIQTP